MLSAPLWHRGGTDFVCEDVTFCISISPLLADSTDSPLINVSRTLLATSCLRLQALTCADEMVRFCLCCCFYLLHVFALPCGPLGWGTVPRQRWIIAVTVSRMDVSNTWERGDQLIGLVAAAAAVKSCSKFINTRWCSSDSRSHSVYGDVPAGGNLPQAAAALNQLSYSSFHRGDTDRQADT